MWFQSHATTATLWVRFGVSSNAEDAICNICRKKAPIKSADATNVKGRLQTLHPQKYAEMFLDVQKVIKLYENSSCYNSRI